MQFTTLSGNVQHYVLHNVYLASFDFRRFIPASFPRFAVMTNDYIRVPSTTTNYLLVVVRICFSTSTSTSHASYEFLGRWSVVVSVVLSYFRPRSTKIVGLVYFACARIERPRSFVFLYSLASASFFIQTSPRHANSNQSVWRSWLKL